MSKKTRMNDDLADEFDELQQATSEKLAARNPRQGDQTVTDISEVRKATLCREWMAYCRDAGWAEESIPYLVDLFWKYEGWKTFKGWHPEPDDLPSGY